ncbi:RHS repeat protein, partial [bacterium]|nr:RHS repeat protein [bacterium]
MTLTSSTALLRRMQRALSSTGSTYSDIYPGSDSIGIKVGDCQRCNVRCSRGGGPQVAVRHRLYAIRSLVHAPVTIGNRRSPESGSVMVARGQVEQPWPSKSGAVVIACLRGARSDGRPGHLHQVLHAVIQVAIWEELMPKTLRRTTTLLSCCCASQASGGLCVWRGDGHDARLQGLSCDVCVTADDDLTDPLGHAATFTYDDNGNRTSATDARGHETRFGYDVMSKLATVTDALDNDWTYTYDANYNLANVTNPRAATRTYNYDAADRLTHIEDATGNMTDRT